MAKLYARIHADRSSTSRTSSQGIVTTAETWKSIVRVDLLHNGRCTVTLTDKNGGNAQELWSGNTDETAEKSA